MKLKRNNPSPQYEKYYIKKCFYVWNNLCCYRNDVAWCDGFDSLAQYANIYVLIH